MTDLPSTARFALPMLAMAMAQKEVTHNEALTLLDALVQPAVEAWDGEDGALAPGTAGGWRFAAPRAGMRTHRLSDGAWLRFDGAAGVEPGAVASPAGGATTDSEARAAIDAVILALVGHGLLI